MNQYSVYEEWKAYRNDVTKYILDSCAAGGSIAVLGAGKCADIDLIELLKHFSEIYLADRDIEAMKFGVAYYFGEDAVAITTNSDGKAGISKVEIAGQENISIEKSGQIYLVEKDFVGLKDTDFGVTSKFCGENIARAIKSGKLSEFESQLAGLIEELYQKNKAYKLDFTDIKADNVVIVGVHSQLNNGFSAQWMVYRQMIQNALKLTGNPTASERYLLECFDKISYRIEELQRQNTGFIVGRLNDAIIESAEKNIIAGLECGNTGIANSRIDGAENAYVDFKKRVSKGILTEKNEKSFVWPFDENIGKAYDIKINVFGRK